MPKQQRKKRHRLAGDVGSGNNQPESQTLFELPSLTAKGQPRQEPDPDDVVVLEEPVGGGHGSTTASSGAARRTKKRRPLLGLDQLSFMLAKNPALMIPASASAVVPEPGAGRAVGVGDAGKRGATLDAILQKRRAKRTKPASAAATPRGLGYAALWAQARGISATAQPGSFGAVDSTAGAAVQLPPPQLGAPVAFPAGGGDMVRARYFAPKRGEPAIGAVVMAPGSGGGLGPGLAQSPSKMDWLGSSAGEGALYHRLGLELGFGGEFDWAYRRVRSGTGTGIACIMIDWPVTPKWNLYVD